MKKTKNMTKLQNFFEEEGFNVNLFEQDGKQCAEVGKWTYGGVNMIFALMPLSKKEFVKCVNNFDIDEEIELHREMKDYKANFTITQSLEDFTNFHNALKEVVEKLNATDIK